LRNLAGRRDGIAYLVPSGSLGAFAVGCNCHLLLLGHFNRRFQRLCCTNSFLRSCLTTFGGLRGKGLGCCHRFLLQNLNMNFEPALGRMAAQPLCYLALHMC
jgi:hypothetical protein